MSKTMSMVISLPGVLHRAAEHVKKSRDWKVRSLAYELNLLNEHIEIVRKNPERLKEFLDLWVSD